MTNVVEIFFYTLGASFPGIWNLISISYPAPSFLAPLFVQFTNTNNLAEQIQFYHHTSYHGAKIAPPVNAHPHPFYHLGAEN